MIFKNSFTFITLLSILLSACEKVSESKTTTIYSGDYRSDSGIGEFFNCKDRVRYFVVKNKTAKELEARYLALGLKAKDDVYVRVEGNIKEEKPEIDGINPTTVFLPTKIISLDQNRGCDISARQGG